MSAVKRVQPWCHAHRLGLAMSLVLLSVGYALLAQADAELARTIGVGYICVVLTLGMLLRLPSRGRHGR